jgi:3-isopropylmalate/(R)-2-methylmalate dehydratase small subunit
MLIKGRVWIFGDNIDTDLMMPHGAFEKSLHEQAQFVFKANRPGWVDLVKKGDIIVAGKNFGTGSSRPAALLFKNLGIEAIAAESVNGLFFRNCINYGLPAFNCPGVTESFQEGDVAEIDPQAGTLRNAMTGISLRTGILPAMLMNIIAAGGMIELLTKEGCLESVGD